MSYTSSPDQWRYFEDDQLTGGVLSRRIWAWVIDAVLLSVICGVLFLILLTFGILTLGLGLPLLGVLPIVPGLYTFLFIAGPGSATPGQRATGLSVRREDNLGRPGALQALAWTVGYYLTVAAGGIWLAVALITVRRRTLHDMAAGLLVVRTRALTPASGFWDSPGGSRPA